MRGSTMKTQSLRKFLWLAFAFGLLAIFVCPVNISAQQPLPAPPPPWKAKPTPTPKPPEQEVLDVVRVTSNLVMLFRMKVLVEPSGVAAAAAVMFRKLPADVQNVGVILSGGNIDGSVLSRVIAAT